MPILATVAFTASAPAQVCWPAEAGVVQEEERREDPITSEIREKLSEDESFLKIMDEYDRAYEELSQVGEKSLKDIPSVTKYFRSLDNIYAYLQKVWISVTNAWAIVSDPYAEELSMLLVTRMSDDLKLLFARSVILPDGTQPLFGLWTFENVNTGVYVWYRYTHPLASKK